MERNVRVSVFQWRGVIEFDAGDGAVRFLDGNQVSAEEYFSF